MLSSYLYLALFHTAVLAAGNNKCSATTLTQLDNLVLHTQYFCQFWLAAPGRTRSPFQDLNAADITKICSCVVKTTPIADPDPLPDSKATVTYPSSCPRKAINVVRREFADEVKFCKFYLATTGRGTSPIEALPIKKVEAVCKCIKKQSSTATTTAGFCESSPVQSLLDDTDATPFCQSILAMPTPTEVQSVLVTPIVTATDVVVQPVTLTSIVRETVTTTLTMPFFTVTATRARTTCVGANPYKRSESTIAAPDYLQDEQPDYVTSACGCVTDLPTPVPTTTTTTVTLPPSTVLEVLTSFSPTISPSSSILTISFTTYQANTTVTSTIDSATFPMASYTTAYGSYAGSSETTQRYLVRQNAVPTAASSPILSCTCSPGGTGKWSCPSLPGLKADNYHVTSCNDGCPDLCSSYNQRMGGYPCRSTVLKKSANAGDPFTCTLQSVWYFMTTGECGLMDDTVTYFDMGA